MNKIFLLFVFVLRRVQARQGENDEAKMLLFACTPMKDETRELMNIFF